jgi:hypothetical protein
MGIIKEKEMPQFTGLKSNFYTGIVEDRNDPLQVGRVRVRIFGLHTDDKSLIGTPDLPWSDVLMPNTTSALSGLGSSPHGLVEGSTVMGFFRDEDDMQDFVVIGSLFGRPSENYKSALGSEDEKATKRSPEHGFNDPRLDTISDYKETNDGQKMGNRNNGRNWGYDSSLELSPRRPESLEFNIDGSGVKINQPDKGVNYPKEDYTKIKHSDVNMAAVDKNAYPNNMIELQEGETVKEGIDSAGEKMTRISQVNPKYPFNHVWESESGHVLEMDDTPNSERLHMYHRSGTRLEVLPDGTQTMKVVNNNYEITLKDKKILIGGGADIELMNGDYNIVTRKQGDNGGSVFITCDSDINLSAQGAVIIKGKVSINGNKYDPK